MGMTMFQTTWIKSYLCIKPLKKSEKPSNGSMCSSNTNVSAGVTQLQLHKNAKTH